MASEKVTALVEEVKGLTVLELSELVHTLEEVFGVSAAAAAVAGPAVAAAAEPRILYPRHRTALQLPCHPRKIHAPYRALTRRRP